MRREAGKRTEHGGWREEEGALRQQGEHIMPYERALGFGLERCQPLAARSRPSLLSFLSEAWLSPGQQAGQTEEKRKRIVGCVERERKGQW